MEQEILLSLIDIPPFDLRYYRSKSFFNLFCQDIEKSGMIVKPLVKKTNDSRYLVLDGINRLKCARKLKWRTLKCDVIENINDIDGIILGLKVNLKRANHDPMGVCNAFLRLLDLGLKQRDLVKRFGFSKGHVSKLIAIARRLSPKHKLALAKGEINIMEAYSLVKKRWHNPMLTKKYKKPQCALCERELTFFESELIQVCQTCVTARKTQIRKENEKYETDKAQKRLDQ